MKSIIEIFCLLVLIISCSLKAETQFDFVQQIDKPLQDTKGTKTFFLGCAGEKRLHYDTLSIRLSLGFSYAVNDIVTFCELPWPLIQLRIKPAREGATIVNSWDALALSVRFGATSTLGITEIFTENTNRFNNDYIRILPRVQILAKMSLLNRLWAQYDMMFATVSDEAIQGFIYPRIGYQFNRFFYGMVGYRGGFFRFSEEVPDDSRISYFYRYGYALDYFNSSNAKLSEDQQLSFSSSVPIEIGLDLGKHFSAVMATSIGRKTGTFVPLELRCNIEW